MFVGFAEIIIWHFTSPKVQDSEIIKSLGKFMGWSHVEGAAPEFGWLNPDETDNAKSFRFDPLKNWNHWRQVEEKVMETEGLLARLIIKFNKGVKQKGLAEFVSFYNYMKADLPTRCKALVSVLPKK